MDANRSVAIAGPGFIGAGARGGPLLVGYRAGRTNNRMQVTGRGLRFVKGLALPAVFRHVLAI